MMRIHLYVWIGTVRICWATLPQAIRFIWPVLIVFAGSTVLLACENANIFGALVTLFHCSFFLFPSDPTEKMTDSKYFTTTKKGEIFELKSELNNDKKEKKKEAVKKVMHIHCRAFFSQNSCVTL